jgi:hypothetical protein
MPFIKSGSASGVYEGEDQNDEYEGARLGVEEGIEPRPGRRGRKLSRDDNNNDKNAHSDTKARARLKASRLKRLKKAYYSKSLLWHPDRWIGMPVYQEVTATAFDLVHEAYVEMTAIIEAESDTSAPVLEDRSRYE